MKKYEEFITELFISNNNSTMKRKEWLELIRLLQGELFDQFSITEFDYDIGSAPMDVRTPDWEFTYSKNGIDGINLRNIRNDTIDDIIIELDDIIKEKVVNGRLGFGIKYKVHDMNNVFKFIEIEIE